MSLIFPGHPLYKECMSLDFNENDFTQFTLTCGNYKAKYNFYSIPFGVIPGYEEYKNKLSYIDDNNKKTFYNWNKDFTIEIFDENDIKILKKTTNFTPNFNLYGDGKTLDSTFITILEEVDDNPFFNIYNLNDMLIHTFKIYRYTFNMGFKIIDYDSNLFVIVYGESILSIIEFNKYIKYINKLKNKSHTTINCIKYIDDSVIIPTCGQNRMYCIGIESDNIIFNNGKICLINNIQYDISQWILPRNPLYYYHLLNNNPYDKSEKHFIITHGIFSAEYDYLDHLNRFDSNIGKFGKGVNVTFKENGIELFEMKSPCAPSIVIHGDGKTRDGTRFSFGNVTIYDFNQKLIRHTCIGSDPHHDIQRVNDKYAISTSIEVCTHTQFFGFIDLDLFFNQTGEEEQIRPYDNARVYVPLYRDDVIGVTCADPDGFVLSNGVILPYESAEEYDFSNGEGYVELDFRKIGFSDEQYTAINSMLLKGQTVSIPLT